jgi:hypothetical protein
MVLVYSVLDLPCRARNEAFAKHSAYCHIGSSASAKGLQEPKNKLDPYSSASI